MHAFVTLSAVGDIVGFHQRPERAFAFTAQHLQKADILFAQNERHYGATPAHDTGDMVEKVPAAHVQALKQGGFDVVSFASNHAMDFGAEVMMETVQHLREVGFSVIGVGRSGEEARQPAIIERNGCKVAFLAYCSVLKPGQAATATKAGVAPMRAHTHYHQVDYQPGTQPEILTFPYQDDLQAMLADVAALRGQVDVLAVSLHWGVHFTPEVIATYQREVAHKLIDAGVDMILGHHAHELKAVEIYRGKPIFYSLGNFAFDQPQAVIKRAMQNSEIVRKLVTGWNFELDDPAWSEYCFPPNSRYSMIARITLRDNRIDRVSFLPVMINGEAQPVVVEASDPRFPAFVDYMTRISSSQQIHTRYVAEGEEIVVYPAQ